KNLHEGSPGVVDSQLSASETPFLHFNDLVSHLSEPRQLRHDIPPAKPVVASEAKQSGTAATPGCFVATLLAMTAAHLARPQRTEQQGQFVKREHFSSNFLIFRINSAYGLRNCFLIDSPACARLARCSGHRSRYRDRRSATRRRAVARSADHSRRG